MKEVWNCSRGAPRDDEIWSFVYAKQKNVPQEKRGQFGYGDVWTWTALDADTKLIVSWYLGTRDADAAYAFMNDLAGRLVSEEIIDAPRPWPPPTRRQALRSGAMRKSPFSCPICHRDIIFDTEQTVCFEVVGRNFRVVRLKDIPAETKVTICCVHEACTDRFKKMVAAGQYPPKDSN